MSAGLADSLAVWMSYRPGDFLMFSPRAYWRLFELHNAAWWPWQLVAVPATAALVVAAARRDSMRTGQQRLLWLALATAWVFVGKTFVFDLYGQINWAARWLAAFFFVEAALLATLAMLAPTPRAERRPRRAGLALAIWAVAVQPLLAGWAGRPGSAADVVALTPDATVIATLGLLTMMAPGSDSGAAQRWAWRAALGVAVACALASAVTLATMQAPEAMAPGAAALAAVAVAGWPRPRHRAAANGDAFKARGRG